MKTAIEKIILEYRAKIRDVDTLLETAHNRKDYLRDRYRNKTGDEGASVMEELSSVRKEEIKLNAQRQCYVQAVHDFDSLLDEVQ